MRGVILFAVRAALRREIVGQAGEETAASAISPPQSRAKCPGSPWPGVIVGQRRLYLTRMTHAYENTPAGRGTKRGKASQLALCCGAVDPHDPRSGPCGRRVVEPGLARMPHPPQTRASYRLPGPGRARSRVAGRGRGCWVEAWLGCRGLRRRCG